MLAVCITLSSSESPGRVHMPSLSFLMNMYDAKTFYSRAYVICVKRRQECNTAIGETTDYWSPKWQKMAFQQWPNISLVFYSPRVEERSCYTIMVFWKRRSLRQSNPWFSPTSERFAPLYAAHIDCMHKLTDAVSTPKMFGLHQSKTAHYRS